MQTVSILELQKSNSGILTMVEMHGQRIVFIVVWLPRQHASSLNMFLAGYC